MTQLDVLDDRETGAIAATDLPAASHRTTATWNQALNDARQSDGNTARAVIAQPSPAGVAQVRTSLKNRYR